MIVLMSDYSPSIESHATKTLMIQNVQKHIVSHIRYESV